MPTSAAENDVGANVGVDVSGTHGTLHLTADGRSTYPLYNTTPPTQTLALSLHAALPISYTNSDNHGGSSSTSLDITVTGTNDAPVAVADTNSVTEDTPPNPEGGRAHA